MAERGQAMSEKYDVVVIGTGVAGTTAAGACRSTGRSVAIVDSRPFGGTCLLRGCDPKKVLISVAEAVDFHNRMLGHGVPGGPATIDWPEMMAFKNSFTDPAPEMMAKSFASQGIEAIHGTARFTSEREMSVDGRVLEAGNFVIATGAAPMDLGFPGKELVTTSDRFLELPELPKPGAKIVFIGGGFISFELAHIANRAGAAVTILDRGERPLKPFDPDLVWDMVEASRERGIDVRTNRPVAKVERNGGGLVVETATPEGPAETFEADIVVHGAGRVPDLAGLDPEAAGVEIGRGGVKVNEYLQSVSNSAVYAAGDAAEIGPPLTPVAVYEGGLVADNITGGNRRVYASPVVPSIVFTAPPLGAVGMLEEEAKAQGMDFRVNHADSSSWYNSRRLGETAGSYKVIIDNESDTVLGAHIFGPGTEELINLLTLAINKKVTAKELGEMVWAYPTFSYDSRYML